MRDVKLPSGPKAHRKKPPTDTAGTSQAQDAKKSAQPATTQVGTGAPGTTTGASSSSVDQLSATGRTPVTPTLDGLWEQGKYAAIVDLIDREIGQLRGTDFKGVDGRALIGLACTVYVFEERLKATLNKLSMTEAPAAKVKALTVAKDLAGISTSIFRRAVELQDAADPQPVTAWVVAKDTHKKAKKWAPEEHLAYVAQKTVDFYLSGGKDSQIRQVDPGFLRDLKAGQLCEYVVDAYDVARAAVVEKGRPSPGHTVLAQGNDAFTAGTFEVQKNAKGEITQVLIGTFSGHFRTGLEAQLHLVRHVAIALSQLYPEKSGAEVLSMIVQREGQATNPRTIEVIGRGIGLDGAEAQRLESELRAEAQRWQPLTPLSPASAPVLAADALALKDFVLGAIKDNLFLAPSARGPANPKAPPDAANDVGAVLARIDTLMSSAVELGDNAVGMQLVGTLKALSTYLSQLPAAKVNERARQQIDSLIARWNNGVAGTTGADLGVVFSEKPTADRSTRIVATINPKATDADLADMLKAGMDVARFNTAHGSNTDKIDQIKRLRSLAAAMGKDISVQVDLEGPKLRLRKFENPKKLEKNDIWLKAGDPVVLTSRDVLGKPGLFPVDYPTMAKDLNVGDPVSMNDGTVQLKVVAKNEGTGEVKCEVLKGGKVWDGKGVAFPNTPLSGRTVTEEDLQNLTALLPHVDIVAQSFVQSADDIVFLRKRMEDLGRVVPIIAKVERASLARNPAELVKVAMVSEALMVARGDLGVEVGEAAVPMLERAIRAVGEQTGRPVMLATEAMMGVLAESRASRADVDALFGAVVDQRFQAIMLGKETSSHARPGDVIREASGYLVFNEEQREQPKKPAQAPLGAQTAAALFVSRGGTVERPTSGAVTDKP